MKKFYLHDGSKEQGPFDVAQLKQKNISKDTPVWHDGLGEWAVAANIDDLKELFTPAPPLFDTKPAPVTPRPHNLRPANRQNPGIHINSSLRWFLLVPVVLFFSFLAALYRQGKKGPETDNKPEHKEAIHIETTHTALNNDEGIKRKIRNNVGAYVKAESNAYEHGNLGGISNLKISVSNTTDYTLDKVRVKIVYIKANGAIWDTRFEDFTWVKPNTTITHKIPDTKRGTSIEYEIDAVKSKALGL